MISFTHLCLVGCIKPFILTISNAAGSVANKMGLPVKLVCAVNENDIVHRAVSTGDFTMSEKVMQTWSSAMDIQVITAFSDGVLLCKATLL